MEENNELNSAEVTAEETGTAMPETTTEMEDLTSEDISKIADEVFDDAPKEAAEAVSAATGTAAENETAETAVATPDANANVVVETPVSQPALTSESAGSAPKTEGHEARAEPGKEVRQTEEQVPKEATASANTEEHPPDGPKDRDFKAEFMELGKAYPELVGKQIPDEVFREAVTSGKTVLNCYHTHLLHEQQKELEQLRSEVKTLRQNADNARRAPVGSVTNHAPAARAGNPYEAAWEKA